MKRMLLLLAAVAFLLWASSAFGYNTSITFESSLSSYGDDYGGARTGLYGAVINGHDTQMVCDDFYHEISDGQHWYANGVNATTLFTIGVSALQFPTIGLDGYTKVAYLVNQMFLLGSSDPSDKSLISQAIWYITSGGTAGTSNSYSAAAQAFLNVHGDAGLLTFANLWVYTPADKTGAGPQEMWGQIPVPEGGAALMYLLLAGVACFGTMFYSGRRMGGLA